MATATDSLHCLDCIGFICFYIWAEEAYRNIVCLAREAVLKSSSEKPSVSLEHWSLCVAPIDAYQGVNPTVQSCQSGKQECLDQA